MHAFSTATTRHQHPRPTGSSPDPLSQRSPLRSAGGFSRAAPQTPPASAGTRSGVNDEGAGRRRGSWADEPTGGGAREQVVGGGGISLQVPGRRSGDWELGGGGGMGGALPLAEDRWAGESGRGAYSTTDPEAFRPSLSPGRSAALFQHKKNGTLRMCVDYRELNQDTVKFAYPMARIEQLLESLKDYKVVSSKLDLAEGFH